MGEDTIKYNGNEEKRVLQRNGHASSTVLRRGQDFPFLGNEITIKRPDPRFPEQKLETKIKLTEPLGRGGMGTVYKAQTETGTPCAVKVITTDNEPDIIDRFELEAENLKLVSHADNNIVQMLSHGRQRMISNIDGLEKEVLFIQMQFIDHDNLTIKRPPISKTADIFLQIAKALDYIHSYNLVHRDVKPENIFLDKRDGHAYLADLGLGKDLSGQRGAESAAGLIKGTPYFMSPEQAKCQEVDGKTDIYSLGLTMYYLLTGNRPFTGNMNDVVSILRQIIEVKTPFSPAESNPEVPAKLSEIVEMCTEVNKNDRPNAKELVHMLEMYLKTSNYTQETAAKILNETKEVRWYHYIFPPIGIALLLIRRKRDLEKMLKAHEIASWLTSGRTRRYHQEMASFYYKQIDLNSKTLPENIKLIGAVIDRQLARKKTTEEKSYAKLRGFGIPFIGGKKKAIKCYNTICEADRFLDVFQLSTAEKLKNRAEEEFKELSTTWKERVKAYLDSLRIYYEGCRKIQQVQDILNVCYNHINQRKLNDARRELNDAKGILDSVPNSENNPHYNDAVEKYNEKSRQLDEEDKLSKIEDFLEDMVVNTAKEDFVRARAALGQIQDIVKEVPPSERRSRLKRKVENAEVQLERAEKFVEARKIFEDAQDDINNFRYDVAQALYIKIEDILTNLGSDDIYKDFRETFKASQAKLSKKRDDYKAFKEISEEYQQKIFPVFTKEIDPAFLEDQLPDLDKLRKLHADLSDLLRRIDKIDEDSVGKDYNEKRKSIEMVQKELAKKETEYLNKRFEKVKEHIKAITGESNAESNKKNYEAAKKELKDARSIMRILEEKEYTERERQYEETDYELKEHYDFIELIVKGREALLKEDVEEAKRQFGRISEKKKGEIGIYTRIIDLEERKKNIEQEGTKIVQSYCQIIEEYRAAEKKDDSRILKILQEVEEKKYLKEDDNTIAELRSLLEKKAQITETINELVAQQEKREAKFRAEKLEESKQSLQEIQSIIYNKLDSMTNSLIAYFTSEKKEIFIKLAQAYQHAKLKPLADKCFEYIK